MVQVKQVLETCLYVDDLVVAEAFYRDVFGLEPFSRVEGRHVFFHCGNGVFLLFNPARTAKPEGDVPVPPHGATGSGHVAFAMRPDDIPAWLEQLKRNNVPIEAEITWPTGGYSVYVRDPAGNSVELATPQTWQL
jgi:catechol 2,3-dioxygenase-like lactoylglutathione lyase family enzyme